MAGSPKLRRIHCTRTCWSLHLAVFYIYITINNFCFKYRQNHHCVVSWWKWLGAYWQTDQISARAWALCFGCGHVIGRSICAFRLLGQNTASLGFEHVSLTFQCKKSTKYLEANRLASLSPIRRMFCLWLSQLTTDRLFLAHATRRSNCGTLLPSANTPLWYALIVIDNQFLKTILLGWVPHWLGFNCALLAIKCEPGHRFCWMGQDRQSLEFGNMPSQDQPHRTQRLYQFGHCLTRWFALCFRWQGLIRFYLKRLISSHIGRFRHALGLERRKASLHAGRQRCDQFACLLP